MPVLNIYYFDFRRSIYKKQKQILRATINEIIDFWFRRLTNVIWVWKCQLTSSALNLAS